jgi:hypothetical protein
MFDALKSSYWQGNEIWGIISTLAVKYAPLLHFSKDDRNAAAETASDKLVMGAVWVL